MDWIVVAGFTYSNSTVTKRRMWRFTIGRKTKWSERLTATFEDLGERIFARIQGTFSGEVAGYFGDSIRFRFRFRFRLCVRKEAECHGYRHAGAIAQGLLQLQLPLLQMLLADQEAP